jgi:hypothetical protein
MYNLIYIRSSRITIDTSDGDLLYNIIRTAACSAKHSVTLSTTSPTLQITVVFYILIIITTTTIIILYYGAINDSYFMRLAQVNGNSK